MNYLKHGGIALMSVLVAGCGGGGGGGGGSYGFVTPKVNARSTYADTTIDNSSNTINQTTRNTVTAVNPDGSYTYVHDDPTGDTVVVNGTSYTTPTETINDNDSGQELSYSYTPANGTPVACTVAPHGAGPNYPLSVGQSWALDYAVTCGTAAPVAYTQAGSVVDVEPVTVPAGTFTAVKLQSTVAWTDRNGTTHTQAIATWRDANTGTIVKRVITTTYSGTPLVNGYPVTQTRVLESQP